MELWESCRAATDARYVVVWADDQTCRNLWWLKFRHPEKMASGICINGELHGLMHQGLMTRLFLLPKILIVELDHRSADGVTL